MAEDTGDPFVDVHSVNSRSDFEQFVLSLRKDFLDHRDEWENQGIEAFLEAVAAWTHDMDGYFKNRGEVPPTQPSWRLFAQILAAAAVYE